MIREDEFGHLSSVVAKHLGSSTETIKKIKRRARESGKYMQIIYLGRAYIWNMCRIFTTQKSEDKPLIF